MGSELAATYSLIDIVSGEVERLLREYTQNQEMVRNIGSHYYQIIYPVQLRQHKKMGISTREIGSSKVRKARSTVCHSTSSSHYLLTSHFRSIDFYLYLHLWFSTVQQTCGDDNIFLCNIYCYNLFKLYIFNIINNYWKNFWCQNIII